MYKKVFTDFNYELPYIFNVSEGFHFNKSFFVQSEIALKKLILYTPNAKIIEPRPYLQILDGLKNKLYRSVEILYKNDSIRFYKNNYSSFEVNLWDDRIRINFNLLPYIWFKDRLTRLESSNYRHLLYYSIEESFLFVTLPKAEFKDIVFCTYSKKNNLDQKSLKEASSFDLFNEIYQRYIKQQG